MRKAENKEMQMKKINYSKLEKPFGFPMNSIGNRI